VAVKMGNGGVKAKLRQSQSSTSVTKEKINDGMYYQNVPSRGPFYDPLELEYISTTTNLEKVKVSSLYELFISISENANKSVDIAKFRIGLQKVSELSGFNIDCDTPYYERLFELLDTSGDGLLDLQEFVIGLALICKGTPEEKVKLSFKAYDLDGNGFISRDELICMFKRAWLSGFIALCTYKSNTNIYILPSNHENELIEVSRQDLEQYSSEMAKVFADLAFEQLDTNNDGKLSLEEFKDFALANPKITASLNGFKKELCVTF